MAPINDLVVMAAHPLFEPVSAWLRGFSGDVPPGLTALNAALAALDSPPQVASGLPVRFAPPEDDGMGYEARVFARGEVATRPGNWHDFFNALAWLAYPRTKCILNGRHHAALQAQHAAGRGQREVERDAITQFDECGIVVVSASAALLGLLRAHEWKALFWQRRTHIAREMRFFVFGHATWDQLRAPFVGLTAKAVLLEVEGDWLAWSPAQQRDDIDHRLAELFLQSADYARPRDFQPLPLLGLPGATPENANAAYYDDTRQFRPRRKPG